MRIVKNKMQDGIYVRFCHNNRNQLHSLEKHEGRSL